MMQFSVYSLFTNLTEGGYQRNIMARTDDFCRFIIGKQITYAEPAR